MKEKIIELYEYRYLVKMLVKRDLQTTFSQTILGVLWFFIVPIFTSGIYTLVFGNFANISTDGIPQILFFLSGVILWNYFSTVLLGCATVFTGYASIMGKVYFPRLIAPIAVVVSSAIRFGIQFGLFLIFWITFYAKGKIDFSWWILSTPLIFLLLGIAGFAFGLIFSSLSYKYKDFYAVLSLCVTMFMYVTPVIYPVSFLPEKAQKFAEYNPLTGIIEGFRAVWFNKEIPEFWLLNSVVIIFVLLIIGLKMYDKAEKNFVDTV